MRGFGRLVSPLMQPVCSRELGVAGAFWFCRERKLNLKPKSIPYCFVAINLIFVISRLKEICIAQTWVGQIWKDDISEIFNEYGVDGRCCHML